MWPHWFRSQRESQLKNEYGFTTDDRKDWFNWQTDPMASLYPKTSAKEIANRMLQRMQQTKVKVTFKQKRSL